MKHICGLCKKKFESEEAYLKHTCKVSGHKPVDPEHADFVYPIVEEKVNPETGVLEVVREASSTPKE